MYLALVVVPGLKFNCFTVSHIFVNLVKVDTRETNPSDIIGLKETEREYRNDDKVASSSR